MQMHLTSITIKAPKYMHQTPTPSAADPVCITDAIINVLLNWGRSTQ